MRTDFNPLAVFAPAVRTDANGRRGERQAARQPHPLPGDGGGGRSGGTQFGTGEANITARLPLMVRPSAPRFLNFGDRFELPVVLQNQTDEPMLVSMWCCAPANLELTGEPAATA